MVKENKIYKTCTKCNINKELEFFFKEKRGKYGYDSKCKECKIKIRKKFKNSDEKFYINNRERILKYNNQYYIDNKESRKKYNFINKEKRLIYMKDYSNSKRKSSPEFKILCLLRVRFSNFIKNKKTKLESMLNLIGCDLEYLKTHLQTQFKPEMTWENHGKIWEIDHIKPCAIFDLTKLEGQQKCFHYTNLQPLFKTTEIAKQFGYLGETGNRNKSDKYE